MPQAERITLPDALRGFAVCGIFIVNFNATTLVNLMSPAMRNQLHFREYEHLAQGIELFFLEGKFRTLFSLLFGLGFAIMMSRYGPDFRTRFTNRLRALLLIGVFHAFFWVGDILVLYALLGFIMLRFRDVSSRSLLRWSAALLAAPPVFYFLLSLVVAPQPIRHPSESLPPDFNFFNMLGYNGLASWFIANAIALIFRWLGIFSSFRFTTVLSMFLLGLWLGREGWHLDPAKHRAALRRFVTVSAVPAIAGAAVLTWMGVQEVDMGPSSLGALYALAYVLGGHLSGLVYAAVFVLWWLNGGAARLSWLAPIGRLALTNYLTQSAVHVFTLCAPGFGLIGTVGYTAGFIAAPPVWLSQWLFSRWWLETHSVGPFESIWRRLSGVPAQPLMAAANR